MKKAGVKAYIAPIVITAVLLIYFVLYFGVLVAIIPGVWKFLLLVFPVLFGGVLIYVCIDRIREIRSGVEDDLSKY